MMIRNWISLKTVKAELQIKGWTVFIVQCVGGGYYSGFCEDIKKRLKEINACNVPYFKRYSHLVPVKVVFQEDHLPFRDAYAKHLCLRKMTKRHREKLIITKKWPLGKRLRALIDSV